MKLFTLLTESDVVASRIILSECVDLGYISHSGTQFRFREEIISLVSLMIKDLYDEFRIETECFSLAILGYATVLIAAAGVT